MATYTDTQLKKLFQSSFNPDEWQNLLQNFFGATELRRTPEELDMPDIGRGYYLGCIDTSDSFRIGLFRYDIAKGSVTNKRVGLRNLVRTYINQRYGSFDAALAVFDSGDHWRLSFICDIKDEATSPKRFTYVFGDNYNLYKTPVERFVKLKSNGITFANIKDAFSVEALSKDFYNKLYLWYQWALSPEIGVTFPNNPETEKDDRENLHVKLIRLITRMLFVWFIKQKHLVPDNIFDVSALKDILVNFDEKSYESGNYYNAILQNLFFATLNCAVIDEDGNPRHFANASARDTRNLYRYAEMFNMSEHEVINLFSYIPFLNGGLFECLDKPKGLYIDLEHDILYDGFSRNATRSSNGNYKYRAFIPNILFFNDDEQQPGLITLFSQYNFTIEENSPTDAEISLDPELLGRVFENLLAAYNPETQESARKSTGSFYTPREIVDYMVDESLKTYLLGAGINGLNANMLDALFNNHVITSEWTNEIVDGVTAALKRVKILDPACGSGAFPMGCMLRIVEIVELLHNDEIDRYQLKLDIIENCVFGVDIQPIAMLICKLRFFISLVCEQKDIDFNDPTHNYGINTLPNLETKFVAANTLLSAEIRKFDKDWTADDQLRSLQEQLLTIRNHHLLAKGRKAKRQCQREDKAKRTEILQYIVDHAQKMDERRIAEWEEQIKSLKTQFEQYKENVWVDELRPVENTLFGPVQTPQALFRKDLNEPKRNELLKSIHNIEDNIKKEKRKAEINGFEAAVKQITEWDPYDQNSVSPFFDPEWMFCLKEKFDIVIGNPPILRGRDIKRYGYDWANLYLIATFPACHYDIENYPAIKKYLLSFAEDDLRKAGYNWVADSYLAEFCKQKLDQTGKFVEIKGERIVIGKTPEKARKKTSNMWFETQDSISYWEDFFKPKIIYPNMTKYMPFVYDNEEYITNQKCFIITGYNVAYLTAFFNSSLFKYCFRDSFPELQGGTREMSKIFFDKIPVLKVTGEVNEEFMKLIDDIQKEFTIEKAIHIDERLFDLYNLSPEERKVIGFIEIN